LAADIQRYLEHRPVLASPPSRVYYARKFLRRNRAVAVGTAAAVAVVVSTGLTLWSLARGDAPPKPALTDKDTIVLAIAEAEKCIALDPDAAPSYGTGHSICSC
jgi:hypothetical protein